ncbi:MAG: hypothetical protein FJW83_09710 [Actinobacteria bacterium]|nr:hypothetical protein [Actinomycetota bacterium]
MLLSTGLDLTQQVLPPRSLFVNHPMGNPFGRPGDGDQQRRILRAVLGLAERVAVPGTIEMWPEPWGEDFDDVIDRTLGAMGPS